MKQFIMDFIRIMIDIKIAITNLPTLPFIFGYLPPMLSKNSEMNFSSYDDISSVCSASKSVLLGCSKSAKTPANKDTSEWFFLNGICTDKHIWQINADLLEQMFGVPISSMHNTTKGILGDLCECVFGRVLDVMDDTTLKLYIKLKIALKTKQKVVVIAHSQGGIIIGNILNAMMKDVNVVDELYKLEVYTFASASDYIPIGDFYCEHFANTLDYVARIGVIEYRNKSYGRLYTRFAAGHLLNSHYLKPFSEGLFCCGSSRLYDYIV